MTANINLRNSVNPSGGFNRLSIDNPFNNYTSSTQPSKFSSNNNNNNISKSQYYNFNRIMLEENKTGLRTNPKPIPMTHSYNLNTINVLNEQKYNPYYDPNNYPQRIDNVKDLMNDAYSQERGVPKITNKTAPSDNYRHYMQKTNSQKPNKPTSSKVPESSRIPVRNQNVFTSLMNNTSNNSNQSVTDSPLIEDINSVFPLHNDKTTYNNNNNKKFQEINNAFSSSISSSSGQPLHAQNYRGINPQLIQSARFPIKTLNLNNSMTETDKNQFNNNNNNNNNNDVRASLPPKTIPEHDSSLKNAQKKIDEIESDNNSKEYFKESKGGLVKNYAYYEESNAEFRNYMEDRGKAVENLNGDPDKIIFCIFDGHGGQQVSQFLQENFATYMKKMLPFKDHFQEITKLFRDLDEKIKELNVPLVGSTASVVYIERINGKRMLYCANVGDSRCVLVNKKGILRLSKDDRTDDPIESKRIIKEGGTIVNMRVDGILMLTRSFGDWRLKNSGVIVDPHIMRIEINDDDLYLIIASDGLWDAIKDEECKRLTQSNPYTLDICKNFVIESLNKLSQDNISCFVISFK